MGRTALDLVADFWWIVLTGLIDVIWRDRGISKLKIYSLLMMFYSYIYQEDGYMIDFFYLHFLDI